MNARVVTWFWVRLSGQKNMFPAVSARYTSVLLWTGNMPVAANVQNFPVNCLKG